MRKGYIRLDTDDLRIAQHEEKPRIFEKFKSAIFVTYFEILENKSIGQNMGVLFIVIYYFQLIAMTFNNNNADLNDNFISGILFNCFLLLKRITPPI